LDCSNDEGANYEINKKALSRVTGVYGKLEVINSGSFCDLDKDTMQLIISTCKAEKISTVYFECHYMHRHKVPEIKRLFSENGIAVHIKTGVETFDIDYRENVMKKGFEGAAPQDIAKYADEVCLLFGLTGQTKESMENDIETGLRYFDRVCINIMTPNTTKISPNQKVIKIFERELAPKYINNRDVDILFENTDFGVGAEEAVPGGGTNA